MDIKQTTMNKLIKFTKIDITKTPYDGGKPDEGSVFIMFLLIHLRHYETYLILLVFFLNRFLSLFEQQLFIAQFIRNQCNQ